MSAESAAPVPGASMASDPAPPSSGRRWTPRGAREALQPQTPPGPPQPPRRRRGGFLAKLSAMFTFLIVVAVVGGGAILYGQKVMSGQGPLQEDKVVFIPRGSGASEIAQILEQNGVIGSALAFEAAQAFSLFTGGQPLKAGEYQFKQHASLRDVRDTLTNGRSIQHSITVPEGLTSEQIVQRIRENEILEGDIRNLPREGSLLPDTYRFERGYGRDRLVAQMEAAQRRVLQEIWSRRSADLPLKSASDLVILASIVEKETGRSDERTRVASVFVNRLNRGMRLESDPTIIYGLVGGKGTLGRGLLATELRQPTPYNTYVINGLPPGPIANPGRAALEATANPSKTRDIFFVADGTGGHAFAETLEQHNRNVARWRQIERGDPAAPAPATPPATATPAPAPRPGQRSDLVPPGLQLRPREAPSPAAVPPNASAFVIPNAPLEVFSAITGPTAPGGNTGTLDEAQLPSAGNVESFPVAPGRRQAMQRDAVRAGTTPGPLVQSDPADFAPEPAPSPGGAQRRGPHRGFDAVEGTAKDPLRNKSFDLTTPKTVPTFR
jgi:UPF0755 protein